MKAEKDYIQDIAEIRSMMVRSSKFLSLSGWAGILAGVYGLAGAGIAYYFFDFNPNEILSDSVKSAGTMSGLPEVTLLALIVLTLALGSASLLSYLKAEKRGEKIWNPTTRQLLISMALPLVTGGLLILILITKGLTGLIAPFTLLFYGLALYNASKFTFNEVKFLGFIEIGLGLLSSYFVKYGILIWAFGFGVVHIVYGIYMYYRYER